MDEAVLEALGARVDRAREIKVMIEELKRIDIEKRDLRSALLHLNMYDELVRQRITHQIETACKNIVVSKIDKAIKSLERELEQL